MLIDEQLNRLGKAFLSNHAQLVKLGEVLEPLISKSHETGLTLARLRGTDSQTWQLEYLSTIDETIEEFVRLLKNAPTVSPLLSKTFMQVVDELLADWLGFDIEIGGK